MSGVVVVVVDDVVSSVDVVVSSPPVVSSLPVEPNVTDVSVTLPPSAPTWNSRSSGTPAG